MIGIVGGMGPGSGVDLASKVVSQTMARSDQEHIPMVLFSIPGDIADRTRFILGKETANPGYAIARQLLRMEEMGVRVAGLACNSAHAPAIFQVVEERLRTANARIQLLHIVHEVAAFIHQHYQGAQHIGILGTKGTFASRLYDGITQNDLLPVNLTEDEQEALHAAIYHPEYGIKSDPAGVPARARSILLDACQRLRKRGAELLVFGCTEFPVAYREPEAAGIPVVDSNMVLARALIHALSPDKLKPLEK